MPIGPWTGPFEPGPRANGARRTTGTVRIVTTNVPERPHKYGRTFVAPTQYQIGAGTMDEYCYYDYCLDFSEGYWDTPSGAGEGPVGWKVTGGDDPIADHGVYCGHQNNGQTVGGDDGLPTVAVGPGRCMFRCENNQRSEPFIA